MTDRQFTPNRRTLLAGGVAATALAASASSAQETTAPDFAGRSVLITGTSSGFGRLAAMHLAKSGATVIASMRNYKKGKRAEAQELADFAADENVKLSIVEIDVLDGDMVKSGVARAEEVAGGGLDLVVNNAGIGYGGAIEFTDEAALKHQFDTNVFGYHRIARAALPGMRAKGEGLIVNISSQLGRFVLPNVGVYCSTKFAVEAMCEAMAYELAPFGVETTIIQPGGYPTRIWANGAGYFEDMAKRADAERTDAYAAHIQMAQGIMGGQYTTDPMDVPRAIAEIFAMPAGSRPLRRPVHPNTRIPDAANAAMAEIQASALSSGAYAQWHAAVTD